jgi:hypothetical protein
LRAGTSLSALGLSLRPELDAQREWLIGVVEVGLEGHHVTRADDVCQSRAEAGIGGRSLQKLDEELPIISTHIPRNALAAWIEQPVRDHSLKFLDLQWRKA